MFNCPVYPIYGPPGTGKTTTLVQRVADLIERGTPPDRIAYVAFTNKAADEARERVANLLHISPKDLPYFSTIHAMANRRYRREFGSSAEIMKAADFQAVGELCNLPVISQWKITDEDMMSEGVGYARGDFALSQINVAHARCQDITQPGYMDVQSLEFGDITQHDVWRFATTLKGYKQAEGKIDFNDMLERSLNCEPIPVDHAIIDEAQDLSAMQWRVCERLFRASSIITVAGDDDQAIYRFSGADANTFLDMGNLPTTRILDHSYRLPRKVYEVANRIIGNVKTRVSKDWGPSDKEGNVYHTVLDTLDTSEGEWLFLVRNRAKARDIEYRLRTQGHIYRTLSGGSSVSHNYIKAIQGWTRLSQGGSVDANTVANVYERINIGPNLARGFRSNIKRILQEKLPGKEEYNYSDLSTLRIACPAVSTVVRCPGHLHRSNAELLACRYQTRWLR